MSAVLRRCAVVVLLLFCNACGSSTPTSPQIPIPTSSSPAPTPQPQSNFPPLTGPSRTFAFDHELSYPVRDYTKNSRFVLYDNGAFVLQYPGLAEYRGGYSVANGVVTFLWEGWSVAGPWGATGSLSEDTLSVQYNLIMGLTDFEDAVYLQAR